MIKYFKLLIEIYKEETLKKDFPYSLTPTLWDLARKRIVVGLSMSMRNCNNCRIFGITPEESFAVLLHCYGNKKDLI